MRLFYRRKSDSAGVPVRAFIRSQQTLSNDPVYLNGMCILEQKFFIFIFLTPWTSEISDEQKEKREIR